MAHRLVPIVVSLVLVLPAVAQNTKSLLLRKPFQVIGQQAVIPNCPGSGEELKPPTTLTADANHVLSTTLNVTIQSTQVPLYVKNNNVWTCSMQAFDLRLYTDPESGQPKYPGPTLLVTRQSDAYTPGDQIQVLLQNSLPASNEDCVWAKGNCNCSDPNNLPQCCNDTTPPNGMNCFHGDNTTNLHFHGTHVSPQKPQDYVLLQLTPQGQAASSVMHSSQYAVEGQFSTPSTRCPRISPRDALVSPAQTWIDGGAGRQRHGRRDHHQRSVRHLAQQQYGKKASREAAGRAAGP
jgi:hypothetical protein